jgi:hypothetical protein
MRQKPAAEHSRLIRKYSAKNERERERERGRQVRTVSEVSEKKNLIEEVS